MAEAGKTFGTCCEELKEALEGGDFEPYLTVGPNEIIYMTIGLVAQEGDKTALVDHPFFARSAGRSCRRRKKSKPRRPLTAMAKARKSRGDSSGAEGIISSRVAAWCATQVCHPPIRQSAGGATAAPM